MNRSANRGRRLAAVPVLALAMVLLATTAGSAAVRDRLLVPGPRLASQPFAGLVLVSLSGSVVCTGFAVAPRKVVTAAHCLARDPARGDFRFRAGLPRDIRLYRAFSAASGGSAVPACGVARAWAPARFIRRDAADRVFGSRAHDYAVLTTSPGCSYPRSAILRMLATTVAGRQLRTEQRIGLAGYPADPRFRDMTGLNLWRTRGRLQPSLERAILRTTGFVASGMSGGPVWRSYGTASPCGRTRCVVGILTECSVNVRGLCRLGDSPRRAVRITPAVKRAIRNH